MIKSPLFCIIIRNHNSYNLTKNCLESLFKLEYKNFKIIVVDDGSIDNSIEILSQEYPSIIKMKTDKYLEFCKSFNVGIRHAIKLNADYIFIVNNDTKNFSKNYLNAALDNFNKNPKIGMFGSKVFDFDGNRRSGGVIKRRFDIDFYTPTEGYIIPTTVLKEVGLFDEGLVRYFEDLDLIKRMHNKGFITFCDNSISFDHLGGGITKNKPFIRNYYRIRNVIWFLKRYYYNKNLIWVLRIFYGEMVPHFVNLKNSIFNLNFKHFFVILYSIILGLTHGVFLKWNSKIY